MEVIVIALIGALITGLIAKNKGYSFVLWFVLGCVLWIVALPVCLLLPSKMGKCPHCLAPIDKAATACQHCGRDVLSQRPIDDVAVIPTPPRVEAVPDVGLPRIGLSELQ
jgi:hypothetical protein